jgi:hypothetical protein
VDVVRLNVLGVGAILLSFLARLSSKVVGEVELGSCGGESDATARSAATLGNDGARRREGDREDYARMNARIRTTTSRDASDGAARDVDGDAARVVRARAIRGERWREEGHPAGGREKARRDRRRRRSTVEDAPRLSRASVITRIERAFGCVRKRGAEGGY